MLHRVAVIHFMMLGEDVKAAQVWIGNGHRQVRQNGSSVLVKPHLTSSIPKNVYSWFPKESVLYRGRQSNTATCFTQYPHRNSMICQVRKDILFQTLNLVSMMSSPLKK